uniref:Transmembrane protein 192 n=1 Tax=Leptobrachium leishanense TaxID=445787 RepID=A0A8C5P8Z0_9ANUR
MCSINSAIRNLFISNSFNLLAVTETWQLPLTLPPLLFSLMAVYTSAITPDQSSGEFTQSADDEYFLDAPLLPLHKLQPEIRPTFRPVPTVSVAILLAVVQLAFVTVTVVAAYFCVYRDDEGLCKTYVEPFEVQTVVIFAKVILWIIHIINERFVQYHHTNIRNHGYLEFYRSTCHLKRLPFIIHSTGNAAILVIVSVKDSFAVSDHLYTHLFLVVLVLELILSLICLVLYAVRICKFNRRKPRPDIIEEENINTYQSNVNPGIGFREEASLEEVNEKQADTIEYLQRHNAFLSKQILTLSQRT